MLLNVFLDPVLDMVSDNVIIQILEHEMIVAGYALLREIDNPAYAALCGVAVCKIIAGLAHHMPHSGSLNARVAVVDVIAEIERYRDILRCDRLVILGIRSGSSARLDCYDSCDMLRVLCGSPAGTSALRMRHQNGILPSALVNLVNCCCNCLCNGFIIEISAHIRGHSGVRGYLTEELVNGIVVIRELGAFVSHGLSFLPSAYSELRVPLLVKRLGADIAADGSRSGFTAARLIDKVNAVSLSKEHIRPALAPSGVVIQPILD